MGRIIELLVFAMILAACAAGCSKNGDMRYTCEGVQFGSRLPEAARGIEIVNSSITTLPIDVFSPYGDHLQELSIIGCGVENIEPSAFQHLDNLRTLNLTGNKIRTLDASWLSDLTALEVLILRNNSIASVDTQIYDLKIYNLLPNLQIWDISYNKLVCVPSETLKRLTKLKRIYLSGNPWSYRCRIAMMQSLESNRVHSIHDWNNDSLIKDCLAYAPEADVDDRVLNRCMGHRYKYHPNSIRNNKSFCQSRNLGDAIKYIVESDRIV